MVCREKTCNPPKSSAFCPNRFDRSGSLRRFLAPLGAAALAVALIACSSDECQTPRECPAASLCLENKCVPIDPSGRLQVDASVTSSTADSGLADTGLPAAGDAGDAGDAGITDAPDSGVGDVGGPRDAAQLDGTLLPNDGLVWCHEHATANVFGRLVDRSSARYEYALSTFDLGQEGTCTLRLERISAGSVRAYEVRQIEVTTSDQEPALVLAATNQGRFEPATQPLRVFDGTRNSVIFRWFAPANSTPRSLDDLVQDVSIPPSFIAALPPPGTSVGLDTAVNLSWTPFSAADAVVELSDTRGEVVLTCETPNDGSFTLPLNVIQAWRDRAPRAQGSYLEARYQQERTRSAAPVSLPVVFRVSRGQRWPVLAF